MTRQLKHILWVLSNRYGAALGWRFLAPLHHLLVNISLHALGYDNLLNSGEEHFIRSVLARSNIRVAVDVGANVGDYSKTLRGHLHCMVYAVEPNLPAFTKLAVC